MSDSFGAGSFPPPSGDPFGSDMLPGGAAPRQAPPTGRGRHKAAKEPKPAKVVTQRSLSIYKIGIAVAVVIGLLATVVIFAPSKKTYVVEASANIPPLAQVTSADVKAVPMALGDIQSGAYTGTSATQAVNNALKSIGTQEAAYPIAQGQQLSPSLFNASQVQSAPVPPGFRLVSISAATSTSVGGSLRPGNFVDMISVEQISGKTYAVVVVPDVKVVAVSTTSGAVPTNASKSTNSNGTTSSTTASSASTSTTGVYVLQVPVAAVLNVTLGDSQGKVYLTLQGANAQPLPQLPLSVQQQVCANAATAPPVTGAVNTSDCPLS